MKFSKYILAASLALLSITSWASDKMHAHVNLPSAVAVGSAQLSAGDYTIKWDGAGENVEVAFIQNGKVKATVQAQVEQLNSGYRGPVVVINNDANALTKIALPKQTFSFGSASDNTGK